MFGSIGTFGARAEKRNVLRKKNGDGRGSSVFVVGSFGNISFFVGSATQVLSVLPDYRAPPRNISSVSGRNMPDISTCPQTVPHNHLVHINTIVAITLLGASNENRARHDTDKPET